MSPHTAISYHIVFSTKSREPVLKRDRRDDLFRYIWGIINNRRGHLYRINGVEDHLHIVTSLHPTVCLADFVKDVKTGSALWIKSNLVFKNFSHWQDGYAAFTCSQRDLDGLIEYIKGQEEHHRRTTFAEEYRNCLPTPGLNLTNATCLKVTIVGLDNTVNPVGVADIWCSLPDPQAKTCGYSRSLRDRGADFAGAPSFRQPRRMPEITMVHRHVEAILGVSPYGNSADQLRNPVDCSRTACGLRWCCIQRGLNQPWR